MISSIVSRLVILVFGTLYPAYASYKAVRTKNVKEYVKWMMYWIVFALFTCAETFTDVFLSFWFPFYYEIKIILVLWLLSPATKGSSILYRKFVHPMLSRREQEIDEYIAKAKEQGYTTVLHLGTKGVNYATSVIMQTAIKGGGGLVQQLRRSYSLSDLSTDSDMGDVNRNKSKMLSNIPDEDLEETDDVSMDGHRLRRPRGYSPRRSASGSGRMEMYFPEVDVDVRQHGSHSHDPSLTLSQIRSSEDVSSGYSSAEPLYSGHHPTRSEGLTTCREPLVRTASVGGASRTARTRAAAARGGAVPKRASPAEDSEQWDGDEAATPNLEQIFHYGSSPSSLPVTSIPLQHSLSQTEVLLLLQQLNAAGITASISTERVEVSDLSSPSNESQISPTTQPNVHLEVKDYSEERSTSVIQDTLPKEDILKENEAPEEIFTDAPQISEEKVDQVNNNDNSEKKRLSEIFFVAEGGSGNEGKEREGVLLDKIPVLNAENVEIPQKAPVECSDETSVKETSIDLSSSEPLSIDNYESSIQDASETSKTLDTVTDDSTNAVIEDSQLSTSEKDMVSLHTDSDVSTNVSDNKIEVNNKLNEENNIPIPVENLSNAIESNVEKLIENLKVLQSSSLGASSLSINSNSASDISKRDPDSSTSKSSENVSESTVKELDTQNSTKENSDSTKCSETIKKEELVSDNQSLEISSTAKSMDSLATETQSVKSCDDQDERKDVRSGRYHKLHAPSPPKKSSDEDTPGNVSESHESVTSPKDIHTSSVSSNSVDNETAVTARLVLQPGVVKTFSSESTNTASTVNTEKFVSNPPKSKKKSSRKQRGSAITRLFTLPSKNQLGHFASYLPFWHSPKDPPTTQPTSSKEDDKGPSSTDTNASSSSTTSTPPATPKPNLLSTAPMSTCSLEYLPYVGTTDDLALVAAMSKEKSNSISNFHIRDMSHSPPLSRRQ